MNIGERRRTIQVEPVHLPVPERLPLDEPFPEPVGSPATEPDPEPAFEPAGCASCVRLVPVIG